LGLAAARKIVEEHEGRITVKSDPGHGAAFVLRLPTET
jgi:signal transduction histidine kinase